MMIEGKRRVYMKFITNLISRFNLRLCVERVLDEGTTRAEVACEGNKSSALNKSF